MNTINLKSICAPVITAILSMSAMPQAIADDVMYPSSMCSFEHRGTAGTLDKQLGVISTTAHGGTIVTCPIPQGTPTGDATHSPITVSVGYIRNREYRGDHEPIGCMLRSTLMYDGELHHTDSEIRRSSPEPHDAGGFTFDPFQVSVRASVALRCRVQPGSQFGGYRVQSAG